MTITDYRNFDLLITRAGERYRPSWWMRRPARTASSSTCPLRLDVGSHVDMNAP